MEMLDFETNKGFLFRGDPNDLIGCRCVLNLVVEDHNGIKVIKPDFKAKNFGYEKYFRA